MVVNYLEFVFQPKKQSVGMSFLLFTFSFYAKVNDDFLTSQNFSPDSRLL